MNKKVRLVSTALILAMLVVVFLAQTVRSQPQVASEFQIAINSASHLNYGLYYPVTYMFTLPSGSTGLTAQYRYATTDSWTSLPAMTSADFFNGVNAVRFDYPNSMAYLSAAFSSSTDTIYIRFIDPLQNEVGVSYYGMPLYYDNRRSAATVSLDDWDWAAASQILTGARIHYTIAIWGNFNPDWPTIQYWYNQGYLEPGGHTLDHPCTATAYQQDGGYDYQIAGIRDMILSHLTLRHPYVPAFITPCGFENTDVRAAIVRANYIADRGAAWGGNAYSAWGGDGAYAAVNFTYSTFDWAGTQTAAERDAANAAFDQTHTDGGIYHLTDHPADGYWSAGSYLDQHINYISNRLDVWYASFGELYLYHYVQERGMVTISPVGPLLPTFTPTATPTAAPEVVDPSNISILPDNTNVLLDFNNFPDQVNGAPIPSNYAGITWNSLVEGPPWAGISTWNFYIPMGFLQGSITFPRPVLIKSLRVSSANNNTITLSSPMNLDASITTPANTPATLSVPWTNPITYMTIKSSTGDQALDDLRFIVLSNAPTATPTPSGPPPTATNTPLPLPTATSTPVPLPTATFTSTPVPTAVPDLIFADGFESGTLSAWTASATDGGHLSVSPAAAMGGTLFGLSSLISDNNPAYVEDDSPAAEPRYRVRFYFNPNSISMTSGDSHFIFYGYQGTSTVVLQVEFRFYKGAYQLRAGLVDNSTTVKNTNWFAISNAPHPVELDWKAATAPGTKDGYLTMWIDGNQVANLTGVANDTRRIDMVRLGPVAGIDPGTRGTYYFDTFESRRATYIGK